MRQDRIKQYLALRESLLEDKASLEARLAQISKVLGGSSGGPAPKAAGAARRVRQLRRTRNPMSLKAAIIRVTSARPLKKPAILTAVHKLGYRFATRKPMATLNSVLYARRQFKNQDGRFSPAE
jgi:hypothetical protein